MITLKMFPVYIFNIILLFFYLYPRLNIMYLLYFKLLMSVFIYSIYVIYKYYSSDFKSERTKNNGYPFHFGVFSYKIHL